MKRPKTSRSLLKFHKRKKAHTDAKAIGGFILIVMTIAIIVRLLTPTVSAESTTMYHGQLPESNDRVLTMKEWVKIEVEKAGLDWNEVYCLIQHESGWNDYAYGFNTNKSSDLGLWQINSIHKGTISVEDRFNYKTATKWSIEKRLRDGNWSAWYGWLNYCQ